MQIIRAISNKVALLVVSSLIIFITACTESNFAHCVIVKNEIQFNGERLRSTEPKESSTKKKEECALKDQEIDNADGPKKGRVRWVNCYNGPDCNEAGEF